MLFGNLPDFLKIIILVFLVLTTNFQRLQYSNSAPRLRCNSSLHITVREYSVFGCLRLMRSLFSVDSFYFIVYRMKTYSLMSFLVCVCLHVLFIKQKEPGSKTYQVKYTFWTLYMIDNLSSITQEGTSRSVLNMYHKQQCSKHI